MQGGSSGVWDKPLIRGTGIHSLSPNATERKSLRGVMHPVTVTSPC